MYFICHHLAPYLNRDKIRETPDNRDYSVLREGRDANAEVRGQSAYDLAARETAKLSSSIWKRVIAPFETVRMSANADSMVFPLALIRAVSSPTMTALSSPAITLMSPP